MTRPAARQRMVHLGGGAQAPYATPTSAAASAMGRANRRADTKPEVRLRSELHRRGFRFRKDHLIRAGSVRVRPDIVFTKACVAVFVDGCFWHGCPDHHVTPKSNRAYWVPKLRANQERDRRVDAALAEAGWVVLRIWEHEAPAEAATSVADAVARGSTGRSTQAGRAGGW